MRPTLTDGDWGLPGLVTVEIYDPASNGGHMAIIEMDFERRRARVCIVEGTDTPTAPGVPICAESGTVTVDRNVENLDDVAALRGQFDATFPVFTPEPDTGVPFVTGLRLVGSF